jgi:hypothetical protein
VKVKVGREFGRHPRHGEWGPGYTASELDDAQARFNLVFPPDLVALLRERRPLAGYDWRAETQDILQALSWPFEGLFFDVEHSELWPADWGEKPQSPEARAEVLRSVVQAAPKLIPILGHRYLPDEPGEAGNPVLSVYQSDIIYYGADLSDYFNREFGERTSSVGPVVKRIRFWSDFIE